MEFPFAEEVPFASGIDLVPFFGVAAAFYTCLNLAIKRWQIGHSWLSKKTTEQQWVWRNIVCSFVNANLVAVATVYCLHETPQLIVDPVDPYSLTGMRLTAFFMGYAIYDLIDMVIHEEKSDFLMYFHHLGALAVFWNTLATGKYIGLSIGPSLVEINTIFLHARRLLILAGQTHRRAFAVVKWTNIFTLVFVRIVAAAGFSLLCIANFRRFTLPALLTSTLGVVMINSHNLHLLVCFYRSDILGNRVKKN